MTMGPKVLMKRMDTVRMGREIVSIFRLFLAISRCRGTYLWDQMLQTQLTKWQEPSQHERTMAISVGALPQTAQASTVYAHPRQSGQDSIGKEIEQEHTLQQKMSLWPIPALLGPQTVHGRHIRPWRCQMPKLPLCWAGGTLSIWLLKVERQSDPVPHSQYRHRNLYPLAAKASPCVSLRWMPEPDRDIGMMRSRRGHGARTATIYCFILR